MLCLRSFELYSRWVPLSHMDRIGVHTTPDNFSCRYDKFRLYSVNISELTSFAKTTKR